MKRRENETFKNYKQRRRNLQHAIKSYLTGQSALTQKEDRRAFAFSHLF